MIAIAAALWVAAFAQLPAQHQHLIVGQPHWHVVADAPTTVARR